MSNHDLTRIHVELMDARNRVATGSVRVRIPGADQGFMAAGGTVQSLHMSPFAFDPLTRAPGPAGYVYCTAIPGGRASGHGDCDPATAPHQVLVALEQDGSEFYAAAKRVAELTAAAQNLASAA